MHYFKMLTALACALAISGCDKEDPAQLAADGKATGAACRHAGRAIEDCFSLNPDALRSAVFDGWKEMNDYMRENNIAAATPQHKPKGEGEEHADAGHGEASDEKHTADRRQRGLRSNQSRRGRSGGRTTCGKRGPETASITENHAGNPIPTRKQRPRRKKH